MALLNLLKNRLIKPGGDVLKQCSVFIHKNSESPFDTVLEEVKKARKAEDMPVDLENPFVTENPKCILCQHNIEPNYRNVRLLSQFVSSFTGRIYGRHITGLCKYKHNLVQKEIIKAQRAGLMGYVAKEANFLNDPDLYDSTKPFKVI